MRLLRRCGYCGYCGDKGIRSLCSILGIFTRWLVTYISRHPLQQSTGRKAAVSKLLTFPRFLAAFPFVFMSQRRRVSCISLPTHERISLAYATNSSLAYYQKTLTYTYIFVSQSIHAPAHLSHPPPVAPPHQSTRCARQHRHVNALRRLLAQSITTNTNNLVLPIILTQRHRPRALPRQWTTILQKPVRVIQTLQGL